MYGGDGPIPLMALISSNKYKLLSFMYSASVPSFCYSLESKLVTPKDSNGYLRGGTRDETGREERCYRK